METEIKTEESVINISVYAAPGLKDTRVLRRKKRGIYELSPSKIKKTISERYGVDIIDLDKKTRKREIVEKRQVIHWLCKKYTKHSLAVIGEEVGKKDHATVLHSIKTVNNLYDTDKQFAAELDILKEILEKKDELQ